MSTSDQFQQLESTLRDAGQMHLLRFWPQLDAAGRERLTSNLQAIDWGQISAMRQTLAAAGQTPDKDAAPAPVAPVTDIERRDATTEGAAALAAGKIAVLLVAGGQGSRLGFEGPKGAFPIGPVSGASLFEIHARKILALERRHRTKIPFLIMTSPANDGATRMFFKRHAFFELDPLGVHFFTQGMLPAMLADGRLALEAPDRLFMAPDGHGGVLEALKSAGLPEELSALGIETVFYFQVDNPLVEIADPFFIGFHRRHKAQISVKVCAKRSPEEGLGVVALRNGRKFVIEYTELTAAQTHARNPDGSLRYGFGSVAIHAFDLDFIRQQTQQALPLHRAFKKIPFCDDNGHSRTPSDPNGYKFERFIFDILPRAEEVLLVPFEREHEFAPVKNAEGEDSPAKVRSALVRGDCRRLESAGISVPRDAHGAPLHIVEIDPVLAAEPAELRARLGVGFRIERDIYLR